MIRSSTCWPSQQPERALELADEYNASATYDAHYLALAERFRAPLWTGDRRLAKKMNGGAPVVHLVP